MIEHPHSNKLPHSNTRPYSVSVIALLDCMNIEINRGPSSFNHSLKASRQKKWSSLSLNYRVAVNAQFLQTKDPVLKFCNDCLASRSSKERSKENKSFFQSFWSTVK